MNRKKRRLNAKNTQKPSGALSVDVPEADRIEGLFAAAMAHYRNGEFAPSQRLCREILARDSRHVRSLVLLGDIAQQEGRNNQAIKLLEQALSLASGDVTAHDNIAIAYQALGRRKEAVCHFMLAIALGLGAPETLVKQNTAVAVSLKRLADAWPRHLRLVELFGAQGTGAVAQDALILALLQSRPVVDLELERLLTSIRRCLLRDAVEGKPGGEHADSLEFFCAIAQQCFINEYVFTFDDSERRQSQQINERIVDALKTGAEISQLDLIVAACYLPLHRLPMASSLLDRTWPYDIARMLTHQIREPLEDKSDSNDIPVLTPVDDAMSLQVQKQYEENPYPRWITFPPIEPTTISDYLLGTIGLSAASLPGTGESIDVLIAGCGTGYHSIETAQLFPQSHILATDISRASLAYARRKTRALGLLNIEYGQADILKLALINRSFDVIEAVGVLHHLSDPATGWRILLSLLRPKGLMFVGLYSASARSSVTAARALIAERGYRPTQEDIRACRQDLIARAQVPRFNDFWSISGCRDLLFNVMEHQFTIPQIKTVLDLHHLKFLGFEQLPPGALAQFQHQFSDTTAHRDLASWDAFEQMHPLTFGRMYLFWVQKEE